VLDPRLPAARRAAAPAYGWRCPLERLFPGHAAPSAHPRVLEHLVSGLHTRRFVGDLTRAPTSRGRQGREGFLRLAQTCCSPRCVLCGLPGRSPHHHPFRPCRLAPLRTTGPCKLLAFGREPLVTPVIGAAHPFQLPGLAFRPPGGAPGLPGLRRGPGARQRGHVHVLVPRQRRPGVQRAHVPIADEPQTAGAQPHPHTINDRKGSTIIGSFP
jgi:hypothetical protein